MIKISSCLLSIIAAAGIATCAISRTADATSPKAVNGANTVDPAEAQGIIFERQQLMTRLDEESKTLGEVVAGTAPPEQMAPSARAIANLAKDATAAFEPNVPGGRAKPEVWSNWTDYSMRMKTFAEKSEEMAKQAEVGNITGVTSMMAGALPCKQCHDVYRAPKKPPSP